MEIGRKNKRLGALLLLLALIAAPLLPALAQATASARTRPIARHLPDPYYPQQPTGQLRLNYYYDRSGRWVKFSDWIPYQQHKWQPRFMEDFYQLYGLQAGYSVAQIKLSIYWLSAGLEYRFRHPRYALTKIETEEQYHKYRNLMFMQSNLLIMRMFMRMGSMYDKRHLYFHDLDFADDLEISFLIARSYYHQARPFWEAAKHYAEVASQYRYEIDLPQIESERHRIMTGERDFGRIIDLHIARVEAKLAVTGDFLDFEGRPRPVKERMQEHIESMYDETMEPYPLPEPMIDSDWWERPLFPEG